MNPITPSTPPPSSLMDKLLHACSTGAIDIVRRLIKHVSIRASRRLSNVYFVAASQNNLELMEVLLQPVLKNSSLFHVKLGLYATAFAGACNPFTLIATRSAGLTLALVFSYTWSPLLHVVSSSGHVGAVKFLVEAGVDLNVYDENEMSQMSAMGLAISRGHGEVVQILVEAGAQIDTLAFLLAVASDDPKLVKLLLDHGAEVKASAAYLLKACSMGCSTETVALLLEAGADACARDEYRRSALSFAATRGHVHLVKLLLDAGADVDARDQIQRTVLHHVVSGLNYEYFLRLTPPAIVRDHFKEECTNGIRVQVVRLLLNAGADVNAAEDDGTTTLMYTLESYWEADKDLIVQILLEAGADVNAKDKWGQTALIRVASLARDYDDLCLKYVHRLLDAGADVLAKDVHGNDALSHVIDNGHADVERVLVNLASSYSSCSS